MWLLVWIIWSNVVLNLCKFCFRTNEHLVNRDKLTISQMMGPNIKSNKKKIKKKTAKGLMQPRMFPYII